jgi:predicted permease
MAAATATAGAADPRFTARPNHLVAWPIAGAIDDNAGRALPLFAGAALLIFLALCANASGLLLTRMTARRRDLGVRLSLGASRWRLLRESVLEHAAIAAVGAAGGIGIAQAVTATAPRLMTEGFSVVQSLNPIDVDGRALGLAAMLGVVAVLVAGVLPAWLGTRLDPAGATRASERTHTESRVTRTIARAMLIAQVAFAAVLVLGAALLVRSFAVMATADRGMDVRGLHTMNAFMSSVAPAVLDDVEARLAAIPGVEDVAVSGGAPPDGNNDFTARWRTGVGPGIELESELFDVRHDYFDFFGLTLVRGRHFQPGDGTDVTIVSERMAAILWPDADPIGRSLAMEDGPLRLQVIGVAKDIALPSLNQSVDLPEMYLPYTGRRRVLSLAWRCAAACPDRRMVAAALRAADPKAEGVDLVSVEQTYARYLVRPRVAAQLGVAFASIGFVTSGAGLFAVLSYGVNRRRREFGIRTTLGATPARLRRSVSGEALRIAGLGVAIGGAGAWMLQRGLASATYGVSALDPVVWLAMVAVVITVTLAASWRPARQAARVDPVALLRED